MTPHTAPCRSEVAPGTTQTTRSLRAVIALRLPIAEPQSGYLIVANSSSLQSPHSDSHGSLIDRVLAVSVPRDNPQDRGHRAHHREREQRGEQTLAECHCFRDANLGAPDLRRRREQGHVSHFNSAFSSLGLVK